jgi:hypothetical protein
LVVAKIPQEPPEFPQSLGRTIEAPLEKVALMLSRFQDSESQDVKGSLRMPTVEGSIDSDQESAFQSVIACRPFTMQAWDLAFHGATSCALA